MPDASSGATFPGLGGICGAQSWNSSGGSLTGGEKTEAEVATCLPSLETVLGKFSIQLLPGPERPWTGTSGGIQGPRTLCLEVWVPFWGCHFLAV